MSAGGPHGSEVYGYAGPVNEGTPVYRWLARLQARPWPACLRQGRLPAPYDHRHAAVLPIYDPEGALSGAWALAVTIDGQPVEEIVLPAPGPGAAVRLASNGPGYMAGRYMAVLAQVPQALTVWARHGGTIWCPPRPDLLAGLQLPDDVSGVAVAWAVPESDSGRLQAERLRDRLRALPGRQAVAVPPPGAACLLPGRPPQPGGGRPVLPPDVPPAPTGEDAGPADLFDWSDWSKGHDERG